MKVLDIWAKANTFPPAVITRLQGIIRGTNSTNGLDRNSSTSHICTFAKYNYKLNAPFLAIEASRKNETEISLLFLLSRTPIKRGWN